jgi:LmbE family N-acetylglucosaminyl deacetylase
VDGKEPLTVMAIGAHPDDIEIGCGGTILSWVAAKRITFAWWVVLTAPGERADEARTGCDAFLSHDVERRLIVERFRDGFLPHAGPPLKELFERLRSMADPDVVLTHHRDDLHQDHRLANELTWNTFRDHLILEYEIPKYDGDLGSPNLFVELPRAVCEEKADRIAAAFPSQAEKHWFGRETILSLGRIRGIESRSRTGFAEAFHARKIVVS